MHERTKSVYFIGIGGIAMSAAAGIAKEMGWEVSGSDSKELYDPSKSVLEKYLIDHHVGYAKEQIESARADVYVASAGEDLTNPEIAWLRKNDIEITSLSHFLRDLFNDALRLMVSGTHGKSTTSALLGTVLKEIDDSSFMVGAVLRQTGSNFHVGDGHYFVVEGDEYKALYDDPTPKFQQYDADIALLTNLEFDHPDVFASLEEVQNEFALLLNRMPDDGLVVYNADSAPLTQLVHLTNIGNVSFGLHNTADFMAANIHYSKSGTEFEVVKRVGGKTDQIEKYRTNLYGEMNVYNALGVITVLRTLGFTQEQIQPGLDAFIGIKRRLELISTGHGITVFDDYAHHPTAISETLATLKTTFPEQRIWAVFEPHTYSRTEATLEQLKKSFADADEVLIAEIYPAREKRTSATITGAQLVAAIGDEHKKVRLVEDKESALKILSDEAKPGDVIVVMAVGSFNTLAYDLAANE